LRAAAEWRLWREELGPDRHGACRAAVAAYTMFMASTTREIPREEWRTYFDDFSRDLPDLAATVEVIAEDLGAQVEAAQARLTGISYDDRDDVLVIGLDAPGGTPEDLERVVYNPRRIMVAEDDDRHIVYDIEDAEHTQTLLRLEPAG
jgi:hypothetical protein